MIDFQSTGNLPVEILLLTRTVSNLAMASGQALINLIGNLSQPVAFLGSSLQIIEVTTSPVTAVIFRGGTLTSETYDSGYTDEIGRLCTVLLGIDKNTY